MLPMAVVEEVVPADGIHRLVGTRSEVVGVLLRCRAVVGVIAPTEEGKTGTEVLILRGEPGLGLLGTAAEAVTQGFELDEVAGVLRCADGSFTLLDADRLRARFGAQRVTIMEDDDGA